MHNRSLFFGDNLEILRDRFSGSDGYFDLIYLDPPFNSNRNYNVLFKEGLVDSEAQTHAFEDSWHWTPETQAEFTHLVENTNEAISNLMLALEKIVGHNDVLAYLTMMTVRLFELHRVLKLTGSIYLHCDPTASHYLKIVMDTIFGKKNFRNEIIWAYRGAGYPKKDFGKRHDVIFRYSKTDNYAFILDAVREPYAEATVERFKHYIGNVRKSGDFGLQELNPLGKQPDDWWQIQPIAPSAKERLGYPTQKPEKLMERIILASSKEGDWVLDPFCGCGTTVSVAEKLKRNWVGIDISMLAVKLIERRVVKAHGELKDKIHINGLPKDMGGAHALFASDPFDFEYWVAVHLLDARPPAGKDKDHMKGADKGIDGIITLLTDTQNGQVSYGKVLVQVKGGHVQRNQVSTLIADVAREKSVGGVFVSLEKPTAPMKAEAAAAGVARTTIGEFPKIQLLTVEELLSGKQRPILPGQISPYKSSLPFQATVNQTNLL